MFPMSEEERPPDDDCSEAQAEASVSFRGPFNGRLAVLACDELLSAIVANMLGEDETATERQQLDALGEIANVVCGNVLPAIAGTEPVFRIGAPEATRATSVAEPDADAPAAAAHVVLDEGWADLRLYVDHGAPVADGS